jgi:CheY-like chemotaxis protein
VYRLPPGVAFAFNPTMDRRLGYRTVSMLAMPLVDPAGEVIGVVQVINKKRSPDARLDTPAAAARDALPFDSRDEVMVRSLASLAAVVAVRSRRAEEARLALNRQIRHAHRLEAMAGLAGEVAHDFNNFLTVITGRSALLLEGLAPDDPLRRHVALIDEAARGAAGLIAELHAFSRGQVPETMAPAVRRLLGEPETATAPTPAALHPVVRPGSATVLVVDDDAGIRALVREILEHHGYAVLDAGQGVEALAVSAGHPGPIHLLLTDWDMAGMDGPALADRLLRVRPGTPVVYMSGHAADGLSARTVAVWPVKVLPKPFSPDALVDIVRLALAEVTADRQ